MYTLLTKKPLNLIKYKRISNQFDNLLSRNDLRGCIIGRSTTRSEEFSICHHIGQPKVCYFYICLCIQQQILRFKVPNIVKLNANQLCCKRAVVYQQSKISKNMREQYYGYNICRSIVCTHSSP